MVLLSLKHNFRRAQFELPDVNKESLSFEYFLKFCKFENRIVSKLRFAVKLFRWSSRSN